MGFARAAPGVVARDVPRDLDVIHHPLTVPIPRTGTPVVTTIHDLQHRDLPGFFSAGERAFRRWAYDGAARQADHVISDSAFTRDGLVRHLGIDPERITVIHLGIDHDRFTPDPSPGDAEALASLHLPERFALYPANLWPHKNHERLIDAFARIGDPEIELVLSGQGGPRLEPLLERARALGVGDRVRPVGFVRSDAVPALYRRAAALVFPSLYEGFGYPPLEAMACGCPVASSTRGSLGETGGDAVVPFDAEDPASIAAALDRVLGDEALRERLRSAGLARAATFTWERTARMHTEVYARVAPRGGA